LFFVKPNISINSNEKKYIYLYFSGIFQIYLAQRVLLFEFIFRTEKYMYGTRIPQLFDLFQRD